MGESLLGGYRAVFLEALCRCCEFLTTFYRYRYAAWVIFIGTVSTRVHPLSSARSVQAVAKRTIPITPTGVELPTLKPDATELEPAAAQSSRSEFCIKHLMQNISFIL